MGIIIECYEIAFGQLPSKSAGDVVLRTVHDHPPLATLPINSAIAAQALSVLEDLDPTIFKGAVEPDFVTLIPPNFQHDLHRKVDAALDVGGGEDYVLAIYDLLEVALSETMRTGKDLVVLAR